MLFLNVILILFQTFHGSRCFTVHNLFKFSNPYNFEIFYFFDHAKFKIFEYAISFLRGLVLNNSPQQKHVPIRNLVYLHLFYRFCCDELFDNMFILYKLYKLRFCRGAQELSGHYYIWVFPFLKNPKIFCD